KMERSQDRAVFYPGRPAPQIAQRHCRQSQEKLSRNVEELHSLLQRRGADGDAPCAGERVRRQQRAGAGLLAAVGRSEAAAEITHAEFIARQVQVQVWLTPRAATGG